MFIKIKLNYEQDPDVQTSLVYQSQFREVVTRVWQLGVERLIEWLQKSQPFVEKLKVRFQIPDVMTPQILWSHSEGYNKVETSTTCYMHTIHAVFFLNYVSMKLHSLA